MDTHDDEDTQPQGIPPPIISEMKEEIVLMSALDTKQTRIILVTRNDEEL